MKKIGQIPNYLGNQCSKCKLGSFLGNYNHGHFPDYFKMAFTENPLSISYSVQIFQDCLN